MIFGGTRVVIAELAAPPRSKTTLALQATTAASFPVGLLALFFSGPPEAAGDMVIYGVICGLIIALNFGLVVFVSKGDPVLRRMLPFALLLKVTATGLFLFALYHVFAGGGDAFGYVKMGRAMYLVGFPRLGLVSTGFVITLVAVMFRLIGESVPTVALLFGMMGLWGQYFFYRAFRVTFPYGDSELAGLVIYFMPSLVFWPSTIGKDAPIFLFIGLTVYVYALLLVRFSVAKVLWLSLALGAVAMVRPHIALMLALSITGAYIANRNRRGWVGMIFKSVGLVLIVGCTFLLAANVLTFLGISTVEGGVTRMEGINRSNNYGAGAMGEASIAVRIALLPMMILRPLPWEVHNLTAAVTSLEGILVVCFMWTRRREFNLVLLHPRSRGFVWFAYLYAVQFTIVIGIALSNYGLLARQRVMMLPLLPFCARPQPSTRVEPVVLAAGSGGFVPQKVPREQA